LLTRRAVLQAVTNPTIESLALDLDSELPTEPAPEGVAAAPRKVEHEEPWCDSEAPTGVEAERPLFPPPPRPPTV
jgi:hypothetical protein